MIQSLISKLSIDRTPVACTLLLVGIWLVFFLRLGSPPLFDWDEGAFSEASFEVPAEDAAVDESTPEFVQRMMAGDGVKGVGGFSLLCGKLRKRNEHELEPLAIISNRCESVGHVPWIAGQRGEVYGLSNTSFADPDVWPKVELGRKMVRQAVEEAVGEEDLVNKLYDVLDTNTLPEQDGKEFEEYLYELRKSIFIPSIGSVAPIEQPPNPNAMTGIYGTQRQTIILVDWEGKVTFRER